MGTASGCPQLIEKTIEKTLVQCGDSSEEHTDTEDTGITSAPPRSKVTLTPHMGSQLRGYEVNTVQTHLHCFVFFFFLADRIYVTMKEKRGTGPCHLGL